MKKNFICWLFFIVFCVAPHTMYAVSMVYNFRIAEITKVSAEEIDGQKHSIMPLVFEQFRKKYCSTTQQNFAGMLGSYIYNFGAYYFRIDGAFSNIKEATAGILTFCDTETDDILFTLGRNAISDSKKTLSFSGLFGVPTHTIQRLQHVEFGYAQVGTGLQVDGAYNITDADSLLFGARYLRFFKGTAYDTHCISHCFNIGNVVDALIAYRKNLDPHSIEGGFTQRIRFGAYAYPCIENIAPKTNYVRSNFYLAYAYSFFIENLPQKITLDFSYSFDEYSKIYGNKYIIMAWLSWRVRF